MLLSQLLDREVVSQNGWSFGKVFDVRVQVEDEEARLLGLVVGPPALRERVMGGGTTHQRPYVPWEAVLEVRERIIVVRDDTTLKESEMPGGEDGPSGRGGER